MMGDELLKARVVDGVLLAVLRNEEEKVVDFKGTC
jgi:hypothetical protein